MFLDLQDVKTHFPIKKGILIQKEVDSVKAVDGVSLSIEKGEILGLVGESGCGKSTLSRTIMQLIPATSGNIILEGESLTKLTSSFCQYHGGADFADVTPAKWATGVSVPVLVVHGDEDELIPSDRGRCLHASFASTDKKWLTVKGGNHDNILITPMPLYAEMADWILEHL